MLHSPDPRQLTEERAERSAQQADSSSDLLLVGILAAVAPSVILMDGIGLPLRLVVALPLLTLLPGYALTAAAYPAASLSGTERLTLSLGSSLAAAVLGGLLLHWTGWGLRPESWVLLLSGLTIATAVVAVERRRSLPPSVLTVSRDRSAHGRLGVGSACLLVVAGVVVGVTIHLAGASAATQVDAGFTQIWLLPDDLTAPGQVRLGVRSMEAEPVTYRLRLDVGGTPSQTWRSIALQPGETWQTIAALPPGSGESGMVEARLYRVDDLLTGDGGLDHAATPYRRVVLRR